MKRTVKYILFIIIIMMIGSILDASIRMFIDDPWITFKDDWKFVYGALAYRLYVTWSIKKAT